MLISWALFISLTPQNITYEKRKFKDRLDSLFEIAEIEQNCATQHNSWPVILLQMALKSMDTEKQPSYSRDIP